MGKPYHLQKSYEFDCEIIKKLERAFEQWGFKFYRTPSQERSRKLKPGDINLVWKTDPKEICVLRDIFLETSFRDSPSYLEKLEKALDDAQGKLSIYIGKKTDHKTIFVMMDFEHLLRFLVELQGFRDQNKNA